MAMNKNDDELFANKVNNFLSDNRKLILCFVMTLVVAVVGLTVYFSLVSRKKADDIAAIEKIIFDLSKEKENIEKKKADGAKKREESKNSSNEVLENSETSKDNVASVVKGDDEKNEESNNEDDEKQEEKTDPQILEKEDATIPRLEELANNTSGYASYLAFYNIADIYFSRKDYAKAKDYYAKAIETVPNSYVLGVLFFNMAVCMEELKENDADVFSYYEKATKIDDFPLKPRAMFNLARLQEKMGKIEEAVATYTDILEKYPDNDFALIGKTRMIHLDIKK